MSRIDTDKLSWATLQNIIWYSTIPSVGPSQRRYKVRYSDTSTSLTLRFQNCERLLLSVKHEKPDPDQRKRILTRIFQRVNFFPPTSFLAFAQLETWDDSDSPLLETFFFLTCFFFCKQGLSSAYIRFKLIREIVFFHSGPQTHDESCLFCIAQ